MCAYYKCGKCGKKILRVWKQDNSKVVELDAAPVDLLAVADHKIYGTVQGFQYHKCEGKEDG